LDGGGEENATTTTDGDVVGSIRGVAAAASQSAARGRSDDGI